MQAYVFKIGLRTSTFVLLLSTAALLLVYASTVDGPKADHLLKIFSLLPKRSADDCLHVNPRCKPKRNIMFLKTHKCASSTIQNILMRYGNMRNLTFVLPSYGNYLGHPRKFDRHFAIPLPSRYSREYNIFSHHTRWEEREISRIMPNDTVYISILKEPAAMFESLYNWVKLDERYNVSLEEFANDPAKYYSSCSETSFARNPISFDFGLDVEEFDNHTAIATKISQIDQRFSLILLVEFMDESLVLLRHHLCWKWEDVMAFRVNARKEGFKKNLSVDLKNKLQKWNSADVMLYEFFKTRFKQQVESYGVNRMRTDVSTLRRFTDTLYKYCVGREIGKNDTNDVRFQVWHFSASGFQLTSAGMNSRICVEMAMAENPFTDYLRVKLWPRYRRRAKESINLPGFF